MAFEQLTVVIPTHQRARYVERILGYLSAAGHRSRVLVADSSTAGRAIMKEAVARAGARFTCEYMAFPSTMSWYRKCYEALLAVQTPLVMLLADDDFVVPSTLEVAAARLVADPTVSIAHGPSMMISLDHRENIDPIGTMRSRTFTHLVAGHESALDRVTHYLRNYSSIFYSVSRREPLASNFKYMSDLNQDYDFGQTMSGCLSLAQGKVAVVDGLYYIYTDTYIGTSRTPSELMLGWRRLMTRPDFSQRYSQFRAIVLGELGRTTPKAEAASALDDAFVDFFVDRLSSKRVGEFERLRSTARQTSETILRLGAIASRGLRSIARHPSAVRELSSPRAALARWARSVDPMSLETVREGRDSVAIHRVLTALETFPG